MNDQVREIVAKSLERLINELPGTYKKVLETGCFITNIVDGSGYQYLIIDFETLMIYDENEYLEHSMRCYTEFIKYIRAASIRGGIDVQ